MDATAAAWLLLGVVLGALALGAVVAGTAARRRGRTAPRAHTPARVDDLAGFFEHPPGSRPDAPGAAGWATLAPPPPAAPVPPAADRRRAALSLAALCIAALALVGTVAVVAATRSTDRAPAAGTPGPIRPGDRGPESAVAGELSVGGLVLEPRAVGVTAGYPEVRLRVDDGGTRLELRLPTYNCLTAEPPPDPVAAGCAATLVEHATLTSPDLRMERTDDRLTLRGEVATEIRREGSPPEPTGRVYDLELTVAPGGAQDASGTRPAVGELRLGTGTAPVVPDRSTLRTQS